jgi:methanogenic corrinoid protein MtbC1
MIADIFELNGWDGYFLGANMPVHELIKFIDDKKPDLLDLSLSIYFQSKPLSRSIHFISG